MAKPFRVLCPAVLVAVFLACSSERPTQPTEQGMRLAPLPDEDAELLALYLSGEMEAPLSLYERIHGHLSRIHSDYDSLPALDSIAFQPPWVASYLTVTADSVALEALITAGDPVWDSLDAIHHPTVHKTRRLLVFPGRLHPERLAEVYRGVTALGNVRTDPGTMSAAIYTHQIYPTQFGPDSIAYLFQSGDGFPFDPIPIGGNAFWCFVSSNDEIQYAGAYYRPISPYLIFPPMDPAPDWWESVCPTVLEFTGLQESWCEWVWSAEKTSVWNHDSISAHFAME